jgi:CHAT domain-containing protein
MRVVADSALRDEGWTEVLRSASELLLPDEFIREIPAGTEILLLPHGSLWAMPFAALPVGPRDTALGLLHPVRYSPSLRTVALADDRPSRENALRTSGSHDVLVVGDPEMPLVPGEAEYFRPLQHSRVEADFVAKRFGRTALLGGEATEPEVWRRLPSSDLLHLASHGVAYSSDAWARESFVALTPDPTAGIRGDGYLTAGELLDAADLTLSAELVTLSACQTGLGNLRETEGTVGLQRAFLAKGARTVLVSLWQVPDPATSELMRRFYAFWLHPTHPVSKAEALRLAQGEVRDLPGYSNPYYWAGFQLVGAQ